MYTCADCSILACAKEERDSLPANCPMRDEALFADIRTAYEEPETRKFYAVQKNLEAFYKQYVRYAKETHGCFGK